jgi:iron complex outermembrane receptor protein
MSIPEALRMVPGIEVSRIDANRWTIASRGFNNYYSNKLLVLMDGRTVYTSLFSGVYWEVQDTVLSDIERIEVIRGPGGTLWGANAVNGVINIVTKKVKDTQGGHLDIIAGTEERAIGSLRYGGKAGEKAWYRVYAKFLKRDSSAAFSGGERPDTMEISRAGGKMELELGGQDSLFIQGDYYDGESGPKISGRCHMTHTLRR